MHWRAADRPLQVLQSAPDVAVSPFLSHLSVCFIFCVSREDGIGELYTYLPQTERNTQRLLLVPPKSIQHPDYGFSVGRGAFTFTPGRWTRVTQRVKMNARGKEDGMLLLPSVSYYVAHCAVHQERLKFILTDSRSCTLLDSCCAPTKVRMDACKGCICRRSWAVCSVLDFMLHSN